MNVKKVKINFVYDNYKFSTWPLSTQQYEKKHWSWCFLFLYFQDFDFFQIKIGKKSQNKIQKQIIFSTNWKVFSILFFSDNKIS